jgi:hypothetical protein
MVHKYLQMALQRYLSVLVACDFGQSLLPSSDFSPGNQGPIDPTTAACHGALTLVLRIDIEIAGCVNVN